VLRVPLTPLTSVLIVDDEPAVRDIMARWATLDDLAWHARLLRELRDCVEHICAEVGRHAIGGATEDDILTAMARMRTPETMAHGERVARYAMSAARELGLGDDDLRLLEAAARLHDIGKLAIPESLLSKPSVLSPGEEAIVRRHVNTGAEILASSRSLHHLASIVVASHEWFSGGGYPRCLAGDATPLAARIIAVADAYDVMTHTRPYRGRLDSADAISELLRCSGSQFDPAVVDAFLAVLGRR
jgi:putative nucleotidyltransferase with HDIG domain